MPEEIYDRSINQRDDNKVPKLEIGARKLDPKEPVNALEQEQLDSGHKAEMSAIRNISYGDEKL